MIFSSRLTYKIFSSSLVALRLNKNTLKYIECILYSRILFAQISNYIIFQFLGFETYTLVPKYN